MYDIDFPEDFLLEDMRNYRFLCSKDPAVPGMDDAAEFRQTSEAMSIMGITADDQNGM